MDRVNQILAFLDGSIQLDGRYLGDDGPIIGGIRRNFWWRRYLPEIRDRIESDAREIAELKRRLARWESAPVVGCMDSVSRDFSRVSRVGWLPLIARPTEE